MECGLGWRVPQARARPRFAPDSGAGRARGNGAFLVNLPPKRIFTCD